ncbi:hypothetical protein [Neolewinella antarctica]|uniref:Magnesium citrate secondary transporter n=1 Tax=Neolewinella antarctica TaxID=442734 RepID=A0ABX0XFM3_9BACT|nr:hypothetical protein [Neolewinella antarctica]NJC28119.1 hypothetical protein [Neolewinella antarctica]
MALFLVHQLLQKGFSIDVPFVHAYLDPLLSIPIMLGLLSVERNWLFDRKRLTVLDTVISTVVLAVVFEVFFPRWSEAFTYDPWDFLAYALGGLLFWFFVNPRTTRETT